MKNLLYTSLMILALIFISELSYVGESSLAIVIIGLTIAIALQAMYLIKRDSD